jgi:hypothetical protein
MKTGGMLAVMFIAVAFLLGGCGERTEETKKPMETAPVTPAPGTPAAPATGSPGATAPGQPGMPPGEPMAGGAQTVKGDLVKIDGEFYVVKDPTGKEVRLHVDKTSKLEGAPKAGDKVEAQVNPDGHATAVKKQ